MVKGGERRVSGSDNFVGQFRRLRKGRLEKICDMMLQASDLDVPAIPPDGTRYFVRQQSHPDVFPLSG